jgi:hypothetical protein
MTKKRNDNRDLTDVVPQDALSDIFTTLTKDKKDEKRMTFYLYWLFGFPIKTCANVSGYSESYAYNLVHAYKKQPKLRHKVDEILDMFPERYKSFCKLRLPQIAEIEGKALQEYESDPKLAIRQPQLLKQVKQAGGVDLNEQAQPPKGPTINISECRVWYQQFLPPDPSKKDIADAEVIDSEADTK